jgi:Flp pilus assembly protein TadD
MVYGKKKQPVESIAALKLAVELQPTYAKAHYRLAIAYYRDKQYALARQHCDKAVELGAVVDPELIERLKPHG